MTCSSSPFPELLRRPLSARQFPDRTCRMLKLRNGNVAACSGSSLKWAKAKQGAPPGCMIIITFITSRPCRLQASAFSDSGTRMRGGRRFHFCDSGLHSYPQLWSRGSPQELFQALCRSLAIDFCSVQLLCGLSSSQQFQALCSSDYLLKDSRWDKESASLASSASSGVAIQTCHRCRNCVYKGTGTAPHQLDEAISLAL